MFSPFFYFGSRMDTLSNPRDIRFDHNGIGAVSYGADEQLNPVFRWEEVENSYKSKLAGYPVFDRVAYVKVVLPGIGNCDVVDRPVKETDKWRWPRHWRAFEEAGKNIVEGMPLEQWPPISKAMCERLRMGGVHTVEQVANGPDLIATILGPDGHKIRMKAEAYLKTAQDYQLVHKQATEIADLREQVEALKMQMQSEGRTPQEPKKRGRPRKVPE